MSVPFSELPIEPRHLSLLGSDDVKVPGDLLGPVLSLLRGSHGTVDIIQVEPVQGKVYGRLLIGFHLLQAGGGGDCHTFLGRRRRIVRGHNSTFLFLFSPCSRFIRRLRCFSGRDC